MKLSSKLTTKQFDNHYWYADELKTFAKKIGILNASCLRKDELELLIKQYLKTGKIGFVNRKNILQKGKKDYEKGLKPSLKIVNYTNNSITKEFIEKYAKKNLSLNVNQGPCTGLTAGGSNKLLQEIKLHIKI